MVLFVATDPGNVSGIFAGYALDGFADRRFHLVMVIAAFMKRESFSYGVYIESLVAEEFDEVDSVACACAESKRKGEARAQGVHRGENSKTFAQSESSMKALS